jgi:YidC/Oxa1 family membrane protein insertase
VTTADLRAKEIQIAQAIYNYFSAISAKFPGIEGINFNFLGLNLALVPDFKAFSVLWIIPILAGVSAYLSGYLNAKINPAMANSGNAQMAGMNKAMIWYMPLISVWFTFTLPAGVGLYWIMSNILIVAQQYILNIMVPLPKTEAPQKGGKANEKRD